MAQEKTFLQKIKESATNIIDDIGESFRDFTDFIVSLKDLATKRDNKKAKEFFAVVAHLGAVMTRAGVSKPEKASVLELGEMYSPTLGQEKERGQDIGR
jgi:hypothetical protein